MNWNDLKVFLAIAESGSLSGAARTTGLNHSTVFRRLAALEASLKVRLFERLPTGYQLTPQGERMLELSRTADVAVNQIHLELAGQELLPSGKVTLTTAPNLARLLLPPAIKELRQTYPDITVDISVGDTDYDLGRREADIALRATQSPPESLVGKHLLDLTWRVCASSRLKIKPDKVEQLDQFDLIGANSSLLHLPVFKWLEKNFAGQIVARANDLSTMSALAVQGVGLALLPSDQREPGLAHLFVVPDHIGQLWLLTHPDLRFAPRIRAVWDVIESATRRADFLT